MLVKPIPLHCLDCDYIIRDDFNVRFSFYTVRDTEMECL